MPEQKEQVAAALGLNTRAIDMLYLIGNANERGVKPDLPTVIGSLQFSDKDYRTAQPQLAARSLYNANYGHNRDHSGIPTFELTDTGVKMYLDVNSKIGHLYPNFFPSRNFRKMPTAEFLTYLSSMRK